MNSKYLVNRPVNYIKDPLHKNALFLIATTAIAAIFGFFFWTIAARLFPVADVGHATALISAVSLLTSFSGLGLGIGLILT
jgi:O-antigen/teichoic acid export membrane protein